MLPTPFLFSFPPLFSSFRFYVTYVFVIVFSFITLVFPACTFKLPKNNNPTVKRFVIKGLPGYHHHSCHSHPTQRGYNSSLLQKCHIDKYLSAQIDMILGVGDGTFAVLLSSAFAILLALVLGYFYPRAALYTTIACAAIPIIIFGIIDSAPRLQKAASEGPSSTNLTITAKIYRDQPVVVDDVIDAFLPVRVVVLVVLCSAVLGSFVVYIWDVLTAPPFVAPSVICRRKQLELLHPTWYK